MKAVSRRTFLTGAAATAAIGVTTGSTALAAEKPASNLANAGQHTWEVAPDPITDDQIVETVEADVVIVGAGIAGVSAFMYAAEGGANTIIVEKGSSFNGRGLDFSAIDTKVHAENGIKLNKGNIMNDLVKASGYKANGSLIRLWADHSGWVFDRLIDMTRADGGDVTLGEGSRYLIDGADFCTRAYPTDLMFGTLVQGTLDLMGRMLKVGEENGGEVRYNTKAEQLVREKNGRVSAVICSTDEGFVRFNAAKGVLLATGDYGSNPEMIEAWLPLIANAEANVYTPEGYNTGDGINMAMWIGAGIQQSCHAGMIHPIFGGGAFCPAAFLKVNGSGVRFCNELTTLPGISNMYLTNHGKVWTIFDADYEGQAPSMSALSNYNNVTAGPVTTGFLDGTWDPENPPSHTEIVNYCLDNGTTVSADTIEELADKIDVPVEVLVTTVARYNEIAESGVDSDFGKSPENLFPIKKAPFYASIGTAKILAIGGALDVDSDMNVVDTEGAPIEGLYAVGNVMGNFFANDYPICCPGLSHGRCLTLGALIGKAMAKGIPVQSIEA